MNFCQIESFIETVRQGSMGRAAKKMFMTQPAVSQQIQKLEKELNCQLFDRTGKKVRLTAEGKVFLRYAEYVYQEGENCAANIARIKNGMLGELNFVASSVAGEYVLPPILNDFKSDYVFADVNISIVDQENILDAVLNGSDVLGVIGIKPEKKRPGPLSAISGNSELGVIRIGVDEHVFIAYTGHPLTLKKNITVADFVGEPLIIKDIPQYNDLEEIGVDLSHYTPKIITGTIGGVVSATEAKLGIGVISRLAAQKSVTAGLVKVLDVKGFNGRRELYCLYNKSKEHSVLTKNFIEFIKNSTTKLLRSEM